MQPTSLFKWYQLLTPSNSFPTVIRVKMVIRRGIPGLKITGNVSSSLVRDVRFYEEQWKEQNLLKLRRITINIFNPLQHNLQKLSDIEVVLNTVEEYLKQKASIPRSFIPQKDYVRLLHKNLFQGTSSDYHQKRQNVLLFTHYFSHENLHLNKLLKSPSPFLPTHLYNRLEWIRVLDKTTLLVHKLPDLTTVVRYPFHLNRWVYYSPIPSFTHVGYLRHLTNLIYLTAPCKCGRRFSELRCQCTRSTLHQAFFTIKTIATQLHVKKALILPSYKEIDLKDLVRYYI